MAKTKKYSYKIAACESVDSLEDYINDYGEDGFRVTQFVANWRFAPEEEDGLRSRGIAIMEKEAK